jgi:hypothetical protein
VKLEKSHEIAATLPQVLAAITSEGYNLAIARLREEVAEASYHELERTAERVRYEVRSREYKRNKLGMLDRTETAAAVISSEADLRAGWVEWRFRSEDGGGRIQLSGRYRLAARDDRTAIQSEVTIEVKIPLLGGTIAKMIAGSMEKSAGLEMKLLEEHASGAQAPSLTAR